MIPPLAAVLAAAVLAAGGHNIQVNCTNWTPPELQGVPWRGWAYTGEPRIFLRPYVCRAAHRGERRALFTLSHEVAHAKGITGEPAADRYAYRVLPRVMTAVRRLWAQR